PVCHVPTLAVHPSAGAVHEPRRIEFFDPGGQAGSVVLAPTFVEDYPHDDRRIVLMLLHQCAKFGFELRRELGRSAVVIGFFSFTTTSGGHVLPDQQSEFVAPIVPASGLDLYMFASHV